MSTFRPPRDYASPADNAVAVVPSDVASIARTRALYIGSPGDVKVDMAGAGTAQIFANLPAGYLLPVSVVKVYATDTTASDLVALY